jgi:hypothetical protein
MILSYGINHPEAAFFYWSAITLILLAVYIWGGKR